MAIHRKDEDSFTELHVNIGEEPLDLLVGDFTELFTALVTTLGNEVLPQPLHHFTPSPSSPTVALPGRPAHNS